MEETEEIDSDCKKGEIVFFFWKPEKKSKINSIKLNNGKILDILVGHNSLLANFSFFNFSEGELIDEGYELQVEAKATDDNPSITIKYIEL